jgi:hypothetical protein
LRDGLGERRLESAIEVHSGSGGGGGEIVAAGARRRNGIHQFEIKGEGFVFIFLKEGRRRVFEIPTCFAAAAAWVVVLWTRDWPGSKTGKLGPFMFVTVSWDIAIPCEPSDPTQPPVFFTIVRIIFQPIYACIFSLLLEVTCFLSFFSHLIDDADATNAWSF